MDQLAVEHVKAARRMLDNFIEYPNLQSLDQAAYFVQLAQSA